MKILNLELKGYKRLALTNIDYIKLTPVQKIQLILGTNGSGKSSILKELSPLPALPAEFSKDGFKIIEISHNNNHYVLKSIFSSSGNKFHFIKDGEELNQGGTTTVYKDLVKKYFNITQEVTDLMMGVKNFHEMSVGDRRNWFTKISEVDYTYAFDVYQKLREELRDIQGAIKLSQSRLVQESEKLLKPEEELEYRKDINDLNELLHLFLSYKTPIKLAKQELTNQIQSIDNKIIEVSKSMVELRCKISSNDFLNNLDGFDACIIEDKSALSYFISKRTETCEEIDELQNLLSVLDKVNIDSFTDIDKNIFDYTEDLKKLSNALTLKLVYQDPERSLMALTAVYQPLIELFTSIEFNPVNNETNSRIFSRESYKNKVSLKEYFDKALTESKKSRDKIVAILNEFKHLKEHDELECPQCKYRWHAKYDPIKEKEYIDYLPKLVSEIESTELKLTELKEYFDKFNNYVNQINNFKYIQNSSSILTPLWYYLTNDVDIYSNPRSVIRVIEDAKYDLELNNKMLLVQTKLADILKIKQNITEDQIKNLDKTKEKIKNLSESLVSYNDSIRITNDRIAFTIEQKNKVIKIKELDNQLYSNIKVREDKLLELIENIRTESINEYINIVKLELSKKEQVVSRINIQTSIVENLQNQLLELNEKADILKIAVKELSPTEGLIAKGLSSFINHFVKQINSFIKKIWLYPLELIPVLSSDDEEVDLDYKFAVRINNNNLIPDISKASSAMKEVIDLAFRLVSMQYLKLQDAPIYLDEFAHSMDSSHRQSAFFVITNLLASSNFSQIFMISHYENSYGSLKNSDITVLCPSNIVIPKDLAFNKNCIMQ